MVLIVRGRRANDSKDRPRQVLQKAFFSQQITAFYEDNFPEVMKNILVVKGEIMHSSSFIRNY